MSNIVTFYSYKGGSGRSMALANVAVYAASQGVKTLVIDWDLEAPGLHRYFENSKFRIRKQAADPGGLLGLCERAITDGDVIPQDFIQESSFSNRGLKGTFSFLSSGEASDNYASRIQNWNWRDFYQQSNGGRLIEKWRESWLKEYDLILIDSRTGVSDTGGICTVQLPDVLVAVVTANEQSMQGTLEALKRMRRERGNLVVDRPATLPIIPLLSRWDGKEEFKESTLWMRKYIDQFCEFLHFGSEIDSRREAEHLELLRIPSIPYYSFGEKLAIFESSLTDRQSPAFYFVLLFRVIMNGFGVLEGKGAVLMEPQGPREPPRATNVFISYCHEKGCPAHKPRVKELGKELGKVGFAVTLDQREEKEPDEGWALWSARLAAADHILAVLSESYGKTPGSEFEEHVMTVLKQHKASDSQFTQVFFEERFRDQSTLRTYMKAHQGGNVYDLCDKPVTANSRWRSLLKRIKESKDVAIAQAAAEETEVKSQRGNGIILVGDIQDFSGDHFKPDQQRELMTNLWKWLHVNRSFRGWDVQLDSTLDGAIIVFDTRKGESTGVIESDALDFAVEWIKYMSAGAGVASLKGAKVGFRVGMDAGQYEIYNLPGANGAFSHKIVGRGPNDCDRLTRLGGEGDVVVSEYFVHSLMRQAMSRDWASMFSPKLGLSPFQALPEASRTMDFRLFTGHKPIRKVATPLALQEIEAATYQIIITLGEVAEIFWELLLEVTADKLEQIARREEKDGTKGSSGEPWREALDDKAAALRVSLFLPNPDEPDDSLACTQFRVMDPGLKEKSVGTEPNQRPTTYSIRSGGTGPVGRAFVSGKPVILHGLPDPELKAARYFKMMKDVGVTEEEVRKFSRMARCYLCFPCSLGEGLKPIAVVCIDLLTSLEWFTKKELETLVRGLQRRSGLLLCLLARTRR